MQKAFFHRGPRHLLRLARKRRGKWSAESAENLRKKNSARSPWHCRCAPAQGRCAFSAVKSPFFKGTHE